jgi:hypothetical protein
MILLYEFSWGFLNLPSRVVPEFARKLLSWLPTLATTKFFFIPLKFLKSCVELITCLFVDDFAL